MNPALDYSDRKILQGKTGRSALWVELAWEGQDADAPFTLPDGRPLDEVNTTGEFASIAEHVWLSVSNPGTAGDMLWTTSMAFTVVSTRMLEGLRQSGAAHLEAFPLTVRRKRSLNLDGYHLVVVAGDDQHGPVRGFPPGRRSTTWLDVHLDVLTELRRGGIGGLAVEDAQRLAANLAQEDTDQDEDPVNQDASLWGVQQPDTTGASVFRLRIPDESLPGQFELPADLPPPSPPEASWRENADLSWSSVAPDGTVTSTLSAPAAADASGTPVSAWWFEDTGRIHLNVDHLPGVHAHPVTVEASLR